MMLSMIQIVAVVVAFGAVLTLTSETFAFAVSRVLEAAFDGVEYRLALRASRRAERLKARRREERRRNVRTQGERFTPKATYSHAM
ncbi:MAG: hypothetical protein QOC61_1766 [Acidobacteriota bacterium]|jgi:hypothetical protein|nr:hypothetical protein [Acidobacteriota bacterium]